MKQLREKRKELEKINKPLTSEDLRLFLRLKLQENIGNAIKMNREMIEKGLALDSDATEISKGDIIRNGEDDGWVIVLTAKESADEKYISIRCRKIAFDNDLDLDAEYISIRYFDIKKSDKVKVWFCPDDDEDGVWNDFFKIYK